MKKILSTLLALCMLCALFPACALGEDVPIESESELGELLPEELIPEFALEEEASSDQPAPEPLIEDLPDLPADLIEMPLLQTMEEAEKYESGTIFASSLKDNDTITLTEDTTLVMNVDKTLKSIRGTAYALTVQGSRTLTVNNPATEGSGIAVGSFTGSAPMILDVKKHAIWAESGDIEIRNDLSVHTVSGYGLASFSGSISVLGGRVDITVDGTYSGVFAGMDITLSADLTVQTGGDSIYCYMGTIQIRGGTIQVKNTGKSSGNPYGILAWNKIEILGGTVIADAPGAAVEAVNGITIQSPLSVVFPDGGNPGTIAVGGSSRWWAIVTSSGTPATHVEIGIPSPVRGYVNRCYLEVLGRNGEPEGIAYWTNVLEAHQAAGADIVASFFKSPEFLDKKYKSDKIMTILYKAMMDRAPDMEGFYYWKGMLDSGCSTSLVVNGFATSAEFRQICDSYGIIPGTAQLETRDLNPMITAFVNRCYIWTAGRTASTDPTGTNYWTGLLINRQQTPEQISLNFLNTQEFLARDVDINEYIHILYHLYLNHDPDSSGYNYWAEQLLGGMSYNEAAIYFANSQEFKQLLKTYGL